MSDAHGTGAASKSQIIVFNKIRFFLKSITHISHNVFVGQKERTEPNSALSRFR